MQEPATGSNSSTKCAVISCFVQSGLIIAPSLVWYPLTASPLAWLIVNLG
jgi:hypothetical protein